MNIPSALRQSMAPTISRHPRPPRNRLPVMCGVLACIVAALGIAAWSSCNAGVAFDSSTAGTAGTPRNGAERNEPSNADSEDQADAQPTDAITLIDDDGRTLWASPTRGKTLELAYLPPGVQLIVAMRPASLANHPEGDKVLTALGPVGQHAIQALTEALLEPDRIGQLVAGFQATRDGVWQIALVAHLTGDATANEHLTVKLQDAVEKVHGGEKYRLAGEWAYWVPDGPNDEAGQLLVVASADLISEIIDLAGSPPPLRREIARLLALTDANRHVTVLCAPNTLFSGGQSLFHGEMARLREPLFWFLGDELSAAALSMHWDDDFFIELIATPTLDTSTERASRIIVDRVMQLPDRLEAYVTGLNPQAYGGRIISRLPGMVRALAAYTRGGFDAEHILLRCYLPAIAGHNLLMGAELTLSESPGAQPSSVAADAATHEVSEARAPPVAGREIDIRQQLQRVTSLTFARDTLEAALEQLSRDIGVEIVILGADLEAEGITKNQSLGIDMVNRPAEEILVEILRLSNPDKTATGPNDQRQKLVYVIRRRAADEAEQIAITTRGAATERGDQLPAVFRSDRP